MSIDNVDASGDSLLVDITAEDVGGVLESVQLSITLDGVPIGSMVAYASADGGPLNHQFRLPVVADGTEHNYGLALTGIDAEGRETAVAATRSVNVNKPTPTELDLLAVKVASENEQRSYIRNVDLLFNASDELNAIATNGLKLLRFGTDGSGAGDLVSLSGRSTVNGQFIQIDFGEQGIGGDADSTLGNGIYELQVDLDGDTIADEIFRFFRLYGDTNGDGIVDEQDTANVNAAYRRNSANLGLDLDGNSRVDGRDRRTVLRNQGATITNL